MKYFLSLFISLFFVANVWADGDEYVITIQNKIFSPKELIIPAAQKIKIRVKNLDSSPAEFESSDLNREKVVGANSEIILFVGPLDAGRYNYLDDFHHESSGVIVVK